MAREKDGEQEEKYVYRISTAKEWDDFQVQPTLLRFFTDTDQELYLLQVDSDKLGDGLIYELVEGTHWFPHFYGPSRSFAPLPLDAVTRAEKITFSNGKFTCSLLD
ncbi:uncharacterized protein LOC110734233 isoform X2 [Chenopodium quinoa]|uniref:uncharacterized protein LOC110734233 isoform X2 n=1 Tax=Chenopodium quinoa TaxID=63459 RepID=UPI000B76F831|nr:uncharacterized protein LOC110734233 isoform X2 [Chenopodium quinoa]